MKYYLIAGEASGDLHGSNLIKELKKNIDHFRKDNLNFLIASRYVEGSKIINWPLSRHLLSKISNFLAKFFAPSIRNSDPKYKPKDPNSRKNKLDNISTIHSY